MTDPNERNQTTRKLMAQTVISVNEWRYESTCCCVVTYQMTDPNERNQTTRKLMAQTVISVNEWSYESTCCCRDIPYHSVCFRRGFGTNDGSKKTKDIEIQQ
eukprot:929429_1